MSSGHNTSPQPKLIATRHWSVHLPCLIAVSFAMIYALLWIWQGVDPDDEGLAIARQWLRVSGGTLMHSNFYLTEVIGGAWLLLTGDLGLLEARLGYVERWSPIFGQFGGLLKVEGVRCHAAASVVHVLAAPQYASSGVLPSRLEWGLRWL